MARYFWFQGASVIALTEQLNAAGPDARLEVHPDGEDMTLKVVAPGAAAEAATVLNEAHPCPPLCP